ncbi:ribonuclease H-like domain-containing protein [Tanacetum coccineum]
MVNMNMWKQRIEQYLQAQKDYSSMGRHKKKKLIQPALKQQHLQMVPQLHNTSTRMLKTFFAAIPNKDLVIEATKKTSRRPLLKQIKTGRKITINGSDTTGYDKSKVECFNCYKLGHFASECRGPRNQDNRSRNQDSSRRTINVEEISSKAMLAIDGAGLFSPPNLDLSNSGLEEFQQPEFEGYGPKTSKSVCEDTSNEVRESPDASLIEELVSNDR